MQTAWGTHTVARPHTERASPLRAWSAADVLALDHLALQPDLGRVLIVNDDFGALTCPLAERDIVVWTDSVLSRRAIAANLAAAGSAPLTSTQVLTGSELPTGEFDTVLVRIPKTSALLAHQLVAIRAVCKPTTRVLGTGMARHIHRSTVDLFETVIGPTTTSRATKKARLVHSTLDPAARLAANERLAQQLSFTTSTGLRVLENPGTFSAGHVDIGTSLLIDFLRGTEAPGQGAVVADLGCGNGILAAAAAQVWRQAQFVLVDVSDLAVAAARLTWAENDLGDRMIAYAGDGFDATADSSFDIVITNPPFHHGHALDNAMTDRLLADAARVLKSDGTAYVVVQRHLQLHHRLSRSFGSITIASKHPSHVVLVAQQPVH